MGIYDTRQFTDKVPTGTPESIPAKRGWRNTYCTNGVTLRAACKGENLQVSGTNYQCGQRLIDAGFTHEQVVEQYGWRARKAF